MKKLEMVFAILHDFSYCYFPNPKCKSNYLLIQNSKVPSEMNFLSGFLHCSTFDLKSCKLQTPPLSLRHVKHH